MKELASLHDKSSPGSALAQIRLAPPPLPILGCARNHNGMDGMAEIVPLRPARDDTWWAVMARIGRTSRVASIYSSRAAALEDREWRDAQVLAHANFLRTSKQPPPQYSVAPMRWTDLPKGWKPLPALGFLRGRFI